MPSKMDLQMMSVLEALKQSYTEISVIRSELIAWLKVKGPKRRRDLTVSTQRLEWIVEDLNEVCPPNLAILPIEVGNIEICANVNLGSKSRVTRLNNASAKMRPALVQLQKANLEDFSIKIEKDLDRIAILHIPGAYE